MTTNIEHIRAVLNTSSYLSAEAFIAQFDDASIEALSPGERLRAWSLGLNSRAFTHKERMHWGDTTVKANRLALRLFGVHVEGNRITTEELPDAHSKKYLVKWIHRAPFFDYGSASGVQQFYVSSLLVSNWLRRNGTPPHMKALEGYVSEHLRRKPRDHQHDGILLDVFAQGILPWNSYAHHLLKDRLHGCSGVKWVRETNQLRLYASRPYVLQDARMAARLAAPLAGLDFSGWVGEGILSLLLSLPCTKRDAITSLSLTNVQQISKDDFRAVLQLLPRIASLTIRGSAAQDWPDIWEILKEHAQGIQSLVIGGAGAQHFQKRLGWPLEHSEACVPGVLEWHRGAEDTIRNILLKRRDYSLWERLTPSLQIGILGHILRPTLCDLSYCFEDLIQLRTACSHLPRETLQLIDSRIEGLTGKRTIALTGGMLDADASRSAICFLRDKNPKELRLKGDWRDQGYILSELLQAMHPTQTLVLENIQLDHPCIKALSSSALSLLGLEITSWTESEELLVELLSQCKSVRSLAFTSCPTLSPHIYTTLDAHCPQLRKLKVRNCPALEAVSFWSPLGLPSGCMAPIQAIARDPASIRKLVLMIQGEDPWIDAHLPLVLDLLATLPTDDVCNIFLWEHNVRGEGAAEVHAFCRRLIRMGCKGKSKALRDRFMRLPVLEIPSPLDPQLLQWLAKPPKRNSIVIHSLDPTDVPLLLEHPFHCKRLDLPDTVLSQENAQALLDTGCELVQSSGPSFWHKPWPGLPEDLASINLLEAMRGEDGARYRLYVARNFLVEAIEGQAPSFPQDYRELLQQSLDEDAVEEAFHLLKDSMKAQAWMSMSSLPYIHRHLLRSIRVVWGFHQLIVPRIALMGLSPRIESEVRIRSESWLPNRGFNSIADLLEFAQSQFIPWEPDRVKRLYVLAQHYGVDTLIRACEEKLCDSWFDQENEIELADLAEHYHMPVYEDRRVARLRRKNAPRVSNEPWYEPIARQRK